jgi:hypothetical protein
MERWTRWRRSPPGRRTTPSVLTGAILRRSITAVRFSSAGPEAVTSLRGRATLAPAGAHLQSGRTMRSALLAAAVTCLALAASAEAQPREPESLPAGRAPPEGAVASLARSLRPLPRALRPVVERVLRELLRCGLLEHGFARLWCAQCRGSVLVAFSCRGRSFCPSCEKQRQLLWAEWLCKEVLADLAHRHVGETIAPTDKLRLCDTAAYLVRNPLSLREFVYLDGQQEVLDRSRMNPRLGRAPPEALHFRAGPCTPAGPQNETPIGRFTRIARPRRIYDTSADGGTSISPLAM